MAGHVPTPHETPEEESLEPYLIAIGGEEEQQVALKTPYGKAIRKRNGIFKKKLQFCSFLFLPDTVLHPVSGKKRKNLDNK